MVSIPLVSLLALLLLTCGNPVPLTLTIGSGPIALVQAGTMQTGLLNPMGLKMAAPSTAGTALIACFFGTPPTSAPTGFVRLVTAGGVAPITECWIWLNNPGGITAVNFGVGAATTTDAEMSEWSGVVSASSLEASGTATSVAGTTITPTATSAVLSSGDLAIAFWAQAIAAPGTVTFTSPTGWTRLADNGSTSANGHSDIEYLLNPTINQTLAPTITSSTATNPSSAAAVIVLKRAPQAVDMSAFIAY